MAGRGMMRAAFRQALDDRAIGPAIAVAVLGQVPKCIGHFLDLAALGLECCDMLEGDALNVRTGAAAVAPRMHEAGDLLHRKAQIARGG